MNPLIVAVVAAILTLFVMYLDSKLFDDPKSKSTYAKNMLFVAGLCALLTHILSGNSGFFKQVGGAAGSVAETSVINGIGQEILTGMAPF